MAATIMIVEDDQDIRRNMDRLLQSEGYNVVLAENGRVALDYLEAAADLPELIILDLMMPVMDGFEFRMLQEAHSKLAHIPIIIMTADGRVEEKKLKTAARDAIRKPADVTAILNAVKKVC